MHRPEAAQQMQGGLRQRHKTILVALGIADVHAAARGIDVADPEPQAFAQAQPQAIEGEVEHPIAEHARGGEDALGFGEGDDIRQALTFGRLDQAGRHPRFLQDMLGVELQAVQIEFDRAPGVRRQ